MSNIHRSSLAGGNINQSIHSNTSGSVNISRSYSTIEYKKVFGGCKLSEIDEEYYELLLDSCNTIECRQEIKEILDNIVFVTKEEMWAFAFSMQRTLECVFKEK